MTQRKGLFTPFVLSAAMIAGVLFTAQLTQLIASAHHVMRVDDEDQARLLAECALRLRRTPPGRVELAVGWTRVEITTAPGGARSVSVHAGRSSASR